MRRQRHVNLSTVQPPVLLVALFVVSLVLLLFACDAHAFSHSSKKTFASALATTTAAPSSSSRVFSNKRMIKTTRLSMCNYNSNNEGLKIAVVGAGPSGLLLSHLLLQNNGDDDNGGDGGDSHNHHRVTLFDGRSDPRSNQLEGRAYALGIGIRGRTAIRTTDPALWEAIKLKGTESGKFNLHLGSNLIIPLRSDNTKNNNNSKQQKQTIPKDNTNVVVEPSLLIYQSELCATLLEKLEEQQQMKKNENRNDLEIHFNTRIVDCNLNSMMIRTARIATSTDADADTNVDTNSDTNSDSGIGSGKDSFGPFDLIVGCDGVNSRVRDSIDKQFREFVTTSERLPGFLKVVRLGYPVGRIADDSYDPTAVKLLIPSGAFIIPSGENGGCCILFSGRGSSGVGNDDSDNEGSSKGLLPLYLTETQNATAVQMALSQRFPMWKEESFPEIAKQLMGQDLKSNSAYKVTCNTYHYRDKAVLVGDAAHSTGGVSGQGLNSALMDALVLSRSLHHQQQQQHGGSSSSNNNNHNNNFNQTHYTDLEASLLEYSVLQVPEGRALYDLFFGPKPQGLKKKVLWGLKTTVDALFRGKFGIGEEPLQVRLPSDLTPFATIRRERDYFYKEGDDEGGFPSEDEFRKQLEELHKASQA